MKFMWFIVFYYIFNCGFALANYENTIHYAWIGDLATRERKNLATLGPQRLQDLIYKTMKYTNARINMWVRGNNLESAVALFSQMPNIKVLSLDDYFHSSFVKHFSPAEVNKYFDLVNKLEGERKFAFAKDMVAVLIVAEFGGYFFDTTTFFKSLNAHLFDNTLEKRAGFIGSESTYKPDPSYQFGPFQALTDYQVFSAPQKGDSVFVEAVKCAILNDGAIQSCFINSLVEKYGIQPEDPWRYGWQSVTEKVNGFQVVKYFELDLYKISAGSWRTGLSGAVAVSGGVNTGFWSIVQFLWEKYPISSY